MAEETKTSLYNAINALHQTDQAIWSKVQAVSGTIGLENLPEDVAKIITTEGKIAKDLLPQTGINLSFNGKQVGTEITSLNFAGTTTITVGDDGVAKIQIGDNMNSSIFGEAANSKAATGNNGTHTSNVGSLTSIIIPDATGANFKIGNWTIGETKSVGTKATTINAGSTGWIHFDEGASVWTVTVYGESKDVILAQAQITTDAQFNIDGTFNKIAQETKYIVGSTGISLTLANTAREDNYPSAVGARGKVTFTINVSTLVPNGGRFSFEIVPPTGTTYKSSEMFKLVGVTPSIGAISLEDTTDEYGIATYSGVNYITTAKFQSSIAGLSGVWNNAATANALKAITTTGLTGVDTNIAASTLVSSKLWSASGVYTDGTISLASDFSGNSVSVNYSLSNAFGTSNGTAATISNYNFNNKGTATAPGNAEETFVNELKRKLTNSIETTWDSNASLLSGNYAYELQVIPGTGLTFPKTNYDGYTQPETNPDYSKTSTGVTRFFTRYFKTTTSSNCSNGSLTLTGLGTGYNDADFVALISIDNGVTWYNMKAPRGAASTVNLNGTSVSATGINTGYASDKISFSFPGTTATAGNSDNIIVKIGWTKAESITITKLTFTLS